SNNQEDLQDETQSNESESDYSISSLKDENTKEIVNNSEDIESEQGWKKIVENWFDMLLEKNNKDQLMDFVSVQEVTIHPNNSEGKWKLETLFIDTLDTPTFIGNLKI
ncbi:254_t:CDS:1, partial [Dentiscutata erythropus]